MVLLLEDEQVQNILSIQECLAYVEKAYQALGQGDAYLIPRGRIRIHNAGGNNYLLNCIPGAVGPMSVAAVRIDSLVRLPSPKSYATGPLVDSKYSGHVFLYDLDRGELLAIIADFSLSAARVAATSALVTKCLARANSTRLAILGSGKQARAHAEALSQIRTLEAISVFSPTRDHRDSFAKNIIEKTGVEVKVCSSAEEAVDGSDIVVAATNSRTPVLDSGVIKKGMHLVSISGSDRFSSHRELDDATISKANLIVLNSKQQAQIDQQPDAMPALLSKGRKRVWEASDVLLGKVKRSSEEDVTLFLNNTGLGIQFAAVGRYLYNKAISLNLGHTLPDEWFSTNVGEWADQGFSPSA